MRRSQARFDSRAYPGVRIYSRANLLFGHVTNVGTTCNYQTFVRSGAGKLPRIVARAV